SCVSLTLLSFTVSLFFFDVPLPSEIYTLSLHDALPILRPQAYNFLLLAGLYVVHGLTVMLAIFASVDGISGEISSHTIQSIVTRSEEHTSELQSPYDLVCRLLLEKKKQKNKKLTRDSKT